MGANYSLSSIETRGVDTQRRGTTYVETYKLACSIDGEEFLFVTNSQMLETDIDDAYVFDGNNDAATNVSNDLSNYCLVCGHIRFYPVTIAGIGATFMELYGGKKLTKT